jgi:hypothetical protein
MSEIPVVILFPQKGGKELDDAPLLVSGTTTGDSRMPA